MSNLILFGIFILLLLAAQFASAKTVDEVIEKFIKARGGRLLLAAVKSIYMEGVVATKGQRAEIQVIKQPGKLISTEINTTDGTGFKLSTGIAAWALFPLLPPGINSVTNNGQSTLQVVIDITGSLVDYIEKGHKAVLLGKELVEGNNCYKIQLTTGDEREMMFWIDAGSYLLNQFSATVTDFDSGTSTHVIVLYRNYKEINGMQFAYTCQISSNMANDSFTSEISFDNIYINPAIDPDIFQPQ